MAKKEGMTVCWLVAHPDHCTVPVVAESWEQATVKAAAFWGVPWAKVAFDCYLKEKKEARRNICVKCGQYIYWDASRELCADCAHQLQTEEERASRRNRKYWYLGRKKEAFGT